MGVFGDRLEGQVDGVKIEIEGSLNWLLLGGTFRLIIANKPVDTGSVSVGGVLSLRGQMPSDDGPGQDVVGEVTQHWTRTDFALRVGGELHELRRLQ